MASTVSSRVKVGWSGREKARLKRCRTHDKQRRIFWIVCEKIRPAIGLFLSLCFSFSSLSNSLGYHVVSPCLTETIQIGLSRILQAFSCDRPLYSFTLLLWVFSGYVSIQSASEWHLRANNYRAEHHVCVSPLFSTFRGMQCFMHLHCQYMCGSFFFFSKRAKETFLIISGYLQYILLFKISNKYKFHSFLLCFLHM